MRNNSFSDAEVGEDAAEDVVWGYVACYFAEIVEGVFEILDYGVQGIIIVGTEECVADTFECFAYGFFLACRAESCLSAFC